MLPSHGVDALVEGEEAEESKKRRERVTRMISRGFISLFFFRIMFPSYHDRHLFRLLAKVLFRGISGVNQPGAFCRTVELARFSR